MVEDSCFWFFRFCFSSFNATTIDQKMKKLKVNFSLDCTSFVILL